MSKADRGFASMSRAAQREIARKGGLAAHAKGSAHQWTSEEAKKAGSLGGKAVHAKRKREQGIDEIEGQGAGPETPVE
jgi:hypothetical protein